MNYFSKIVNKKTLLNINFYLFLFFVVRLFHITNLPLEVSHNWRQTTVAMVSRNFYETNSNILYPRVDFAGTKTGITGMEFPTLNYLTYLTSLLFGYEHWYGRLINLIISSFGIYFFHKLIKQYFNPRIAFNSAIVLLFSIWFAFSRKMMPDTFSFSLMIIAIYYGSNYFENKRLTSLFFYLFFCLIGILSKLPSGYILIVFSLFIFNSNYGLSQKKIFIAGNIVIFIPIICWYYYWVPHLNKTFDFFHFYMGDSIAKGFNELKNHLFDTCAKFFDNAIKFIGFAFFIFGFYKAYLLKNKKLLYVFSSASLLFLIVILKAGFAFHHHNYYVIPFVPVMALVCGYGISLLKSEKWQMIILIAISLEGIFNYQDDFFIKPKDYQVYNLEKDLDSIGNKTDLILINSENIPTPMYFTHRKGIITYNDSLLNNVFLMKHKTKGYKFIVILKQSFGTEITLKLPLKINNSYYAIYQL